jgi:hypothetical protein
LESKAARLYPANLDLILIHDTIIQVGKHERILTAIFAEPVRANVKWADVEALLKNKGAEISPGRGSRIRVVLNGVAAVFHRPHPRPEIDKGAIQSVRRFLTEAGVKS